MDRRPARSLRSVISGLLALPLALTLTLAPGASARPKLQAVFSPDGGFHPENRKPVKLSDGTEVPPNLNVVADDMIRSTRSGGRIEIVMYAFSDMKALASLVERAREGVAIRMVLDACADWTTELRDMVFKELATQKAQADRDTVPFDVQVKTIPCSRFVAFGRSKTLEPAPGEESGKEIVGTMHEKFGVFFEPRRKWPSHAFAGSSNFAKAAATLYAENRTFFRDDPVAAAQLHEEFQRLWKYWSDCAFGTCEEVGEIRDVEAGPRDIRMVFNGEPLQGGDPKDPAKTKYWRRIDRAIEQVVEGLSPDGTLDFAMFSFTHWQLMQKLLAQAKLYPKARVRVLLDLSMLASDNPDRPGVLGPKMEQEAKTQGLKNFEVRYKWRSNAHAYDPDHPELPPGLYHFKSYLLHHKMVLVNGQVVANGSYNWSGGAERRNLENIQIFDSTKNPAHTPVVQGFAREFDAIWNAANPEDPKLVDTFRPNPQVVRGDQGRQLQAKIVAALKSKGAKAIMAEFDKLTVRGEDAIRASDRSLTVADIAKATKLAPDQVKQVIEKLRDATMLRRVGKSGYALAD